MQDDKLNFGTDSNDVQPLNVDDIDVEVLKSYNGTVFRLAQSWNIWVTTAPLVLKNGAYLRDLQPLKNALNDVDVEVGGM